MGSTQPLFPRRGVEVDRLVRRLVRTIDARYRLFKQLTAFDAA